MIVVPPPVNRATSPATRKIGGFYESPRMDETTTPGDAPLRRLVPGRFPLLSHSLDGFLRRRPACPSQVCFDPQRPLIMILDHCGSATIQSLLIRYHSFTHRVVWMRPEAASRQESPRAESVSAGLCSAGADAFGSWWNVPG